MSKYVLVLFLFTIPFFGAYAQQDAAATTPHNDKDYYADPFSDFSELESQDEEEEEEAMERFYSYGRLFHIELFGDMATPTGSMSDIYHTGWMMGGRISYFLDWNIAITFHIGMGQLSVSFLNSDPLTYNAFPTFTGTAVLFDMGFGIKYYFNLKDISRVIAYLNPAIKVGAEFSIINDSMDTAYGPPLAPDISHRSVAPGLFAGMGMEIPIFRKKIFLGADFTYHMSFFPSSNPKIPTGSTYFQNLDYSGGYMTYGGQLIWNL
ncbi:MAG: hypothetical protein V1647_04910 [Pseudomonadota bacterium]